MFPCLFCSAGLSHVVLSPHGFVMSLTPCVILIWKATCKKIRGMKQCIPSGNFLFALQVPGGINIQGSFYCNFRIRFSE